MNKIIRCATESDARNIRKLWNECFDDPKEWTDWYFQERLLLKNTYVLELDNQIVSSATLQYYVYNIMGKDVLAPNIVGVCTHPNYRKNGYMGEILNHITRELYVKGFAFIVNTPDNPAVYRKFGYAPVVKRKKCTVKGVNNNPLKSGSFHNIYTEFAQRYSCMVRRDVRDMKNRLSDVLCDDGAGITNGGAYALFHLTGEDCYVDELCFLDEESMESLLDCLPGKNINFTIPSNITSPDKALFKEFSYVLMRIVNIDKFCEIVAGNIKGSVEVCDDVVEHNNGRFDANGRVTGEGNVCLDIGEFCMWAFADIPTFNTDPY